jgi:hypothetical protein
MEVTWNGAEEAHAYFGGPVQPQLGTVLFAPKDRPTGPGGPLAQEPPNGVTEASEVSEAELAGGGPEAGEGGRAGKNRRWRGLMGMEPRWG